MRPVLLALVVALMPLLAAGCGMERSEAVCHGGIVCVGPRPPDGALLAVCSDPVLECTPDGRAEWSVGDRPTCEGRIVDPAAETYPPACPGGGDAYCVVLPDQPCY